METLGGRPVAQLRLGGLGRQLGTGGGRPGVRAGGPRAWGELRPGLRGNRACPELSTSPLVRAFRFLPAASFSHVSPLPPPPLHTGSSGRAGGWCPSSVTWAPKSLLWVCTSSIRCVHMCVRRVPMDARVCAPCDYKCRHVPVCPQIRLRSRALCLHGDICTCVSRLSRRRCSVLLHVSTCACACSVCVHVGEPAWLGSRDLGSLAEGGFCVSRISQVCIVTVSTGACFWCLRIPAPPAACAGHHGASGVQRPWQSQRRSGEWPE